MTRKQKRLTSIGVIGLVIACALGLAAIALNDEIVFFYDPSDIVVGNKVAPGQKFRIGGLVEDGSVSKQSTQVSFIVTDGAHSVPVTYDGILPDLFREGQGIIAEGELTKDGEFVAQNVLAKHDEQYIPKELEGILKEKGVYKGEGNDQ